ncbi:MAG: class II fructose-bisphosphate aldolase [Phycicoccus sp.]|nr:class II fructose-bisphosphate aldolase [Phycicoccus sp.]
MPLVNTLDLVLAAGAGGYAVPAVNVADELSMRATVAAAQAVESPVIIQTSVKTVRMLGSDILAFVARSLANRASVPVSLHLDHCPDRAVITEAIAAGWTSVLFDASDRDLAAATRETAEVVAQAHAAGVSVESEIENIVGVEDGVGGDDLTHAYSVATLIEVAEETGSDLIAPQLGTAHGLYKAEPVLRVDRVRQLAALSDIPIVLHGGTGLAAEDFRAFIDAGISKINISTALKLAYLQACQDHLEAARASGVHEPVKMFADVTTAVEQVVREHAELFGSAGQANA